MALFSKLVAKIKNPFGGAISAADWADIEQSLLESDLGAANTAEILEIARKSKGDEIEATVTSALTHWLSSANRELATYIDRPITILVVGVNGTGKTTSTAKLAALLQNQGQSVVLAAADTFRAAAVEQLQTWGQRLNIPVVSGKANGDPAAVAFDAAKSAQANGAHYLLVDTAGRLHTKSGLMDELGKVRRVLEKASPVDEVLLVVDATTGQNGINQAKEFISSAAVTGLILTKMDGSAKGGIALAIERATGVPVKFVGTGEQVGDLAPFDSARYLAGLF